MAPMNSSHDIEQRVTELEIKASFAEDLLDQLNQTILRQQQAIEALARQLMALREQGQQGDSAAYRSLRDELPPHY